VSVFIAKNNFISLKQPEQLTVLCHFTMCS